MLLFDNMSIAWRLRGGARKKVELLQVVVQMSRYVNPCFMRWFLTNGDVCLGRTARAGLDAYCCRAEYEVKMVLRCLRSGCCEMCCGAVLVRRLSTYGSQVAFAEVNAMVT